VKSAKATVIQTRVMERVHTKIQRHVHALDDALWLLEDSFMLHFDPHHKAELSMKWALVREHWNEGLAVLDKVSMLAYHNMILDQVSMPAYYDMADMDTLYLSDEASKGDQTHSTTIKDIVDALARIKTQHNEMQQMEQQIAAAATLDGDRATFAEQLYKLWKQRVHRPRVLCSHGVSSRTGQGQKELRRAIAWLMEDMWLFAHVGARVPLNYSMLERLAHQGHTHGSGGYKHDDISNEADLERWELQVTRHVAAWATARLRTVWVAGEVGMDKDELHSALMLLHATGSVLHYGTDTRHGSHAL